MTGTVLLVCGSRSLADTDAASWWAQSTLGAHLLHLAPGDVVLSGGAVGPDTWARIVAHGRRLAVVEYLKDGSRLDWRPGGDPERCSRRSRWCEGLPDPDPTMAPLVRNLAMLDALATAQRRGFAVRVLGLVDTGSRTRGADHTLRHAARRGYPVERLTWPPPAGV